MPIPILLTIEKQVGIVIHICFIFRNKYGQKSSSTTGNSAIKHGIKRKEPIDWLFLFIRRDTSTITLLSIV